VHQTLSEYASRRRMYVQASTLMTVVWLYGSTLRPRLTCTTRSSLCVHCVTSSGPSRSSALMRTIRFYQLPSSSRSRLSSTSTHDRITSTDIFIHERTVCHLTSRSVAQQYFYLGLPACGAFKLSRGDDCPSIRCFVCDDFTYASAQMTVIACFT